MRIDLRFDSDYLPILTKLQSYDEGMIEFCKHSLEKFTKYLIYTGKDLQTTAIDDLTPTVDSINSETDIKAFIANNKTGNPMFQREDFHSAPDLTLPNGKLIKIEQLNSLKSALSSSPSTEE